MNTFHHLHYLHLQGAAGGLHTSHPEYNEMTLAQTGAVLDDSKDWSSMLFPLVDELPARLLDPSLHTYADGTRPDYNQDGVYDAADDQVTILGRCTHTV